MGKIEDLFEVRCNVGAKLENILRDRKITKADLCRGTGVSRPTIDKILDGSITNVTNYDKHINKIMKFLDITPDYLLGNIRKNRTKNIREILSESIDLISEMTDIPIERLKDIEAGAEATIVELRDIALCLNTSVNALLGNNFFDIQISQMDLLVDDCDEDDLEEASGFWGHVGIVLNNASKCQWYPITSRTRQHIYYNMNKDFIVIPCMNNKVLYLNMENVNKIILLDDDDDAPGNLDWNSEISAGEIPLVIYEALPDYECDEEDTMSEKFYECIEKIIEKYGWDEENLVEITDFVSIYYKDGKINHRDINFDREENISDIVSYIYSYDDADLMDKVIYYTDYQEMENIVVLKNIAMIELPFIALENAINEKIE